MKILLTHSSLIPPGGVMLQAFYDKSHLESGMPMLDPAYRRGFPSCKNVDSWLSLALN